MGAVGLFEDAIERMELCRQSCVDLLHGNNANFNPGGAQDYIRRTELALDRLKGELELIRSYIPTNVEHCASELSMVFEELDELAKSEINKLRFANVRLSNDLSFAIRELEIYEEEFLRLKMENAKLEEGIRNVKSANQNLLSMLKQYGSEIEILRSKDKNSNKIEKPAEGNSMQVINEIPPISAEKLEALKSKFSIS